MKISESPKNRIFPKRLTHGFGQYLYLVLVKTTLEIRFNNVVDRKETFFEYKNKIFQSPKNHNFPKGFTHAIDKKIQFFLYLFLAKTRLEMRFKNVLNRKKNFFLSIKTNFFKVPKIAFFQRG